MENFNGCQIPNLRSIAEGNADSDPQPLSKRLKKALAKPWNYQVKRYLKRVYFLFKRWFTKNERKAINVMANEDKLALVHLQAGDLVRVRSLEEIYSTLDPFKELKGCAFLEDMKQYCGTQQRVFKVMERFLDERDYKVKKTKGIVLLEGVFCQGTPVFGRCDRACLSFWRVEWLEKIGEG